MPGSVLRRWEPGSHPSGWMRRARLGMDDGPSELLSMTSSASSAAWLPAALTRAAVVTPPAAQWVPTTGRHSAPEVVTPVAMTGDRDRHGRHAEPEWSRQMFDSLRDEDPFDWLGFAHAG